PGGLVDRELHNRVGVFLIGRSEALVGVGRVKKSGGGIEAKKAWRVPVGRDPARRRQGSAALIGGENRDAVVASVRRVDKASVGRDGDLGAAELAGEVRGR